VPGSLPGLRTGTKPQPSSRASAAPRMKPRASMPATASGGAARQAPADASMAPANAAASASTGVMSLNTIPGRGKSGTSRIRRDQWGTAALLDGGVRRRWRAGSVLRREPQQAPALAVLAHAPRPVRALAHAADACAHGKALRLARAALAVAREPHQRLRRQAAGEGVALPLREQVAVVEHQARGRDHRSPGDRGGVELGPGGVVGDRAAVVVVAVGDDGVAVVGAALDPVEFVAALRAHLDVPGLAVRVEGQAQRVAVAQRPYLRGDPAL